MAEDANIVVLVADGEHARVVRFVPGKGLHTEAELTSEFAHKRDQDLASDRPGSSSQDNTWGHDAYTPRHDPHRMAKQRFAYEIAKELNAICGAGSVDKLVLVAPAHVMVDIRHKLSAETAALAVGTIEKDLVKTPDHELWPHLRQWVPAAHAPRVS